LEKMHRFKHLKRMVNKMKTLIVSDELYEKLKEASERYKKDQLELPDLSTIGEFLTSFKLADNPCLDCVKKEYRETINNRR
jgi:hypothetical protein